MVPDPGPLGSTRTDSAWELGGIALLTVSAVLIHGYHLGSDDAAIYVPAIKKFADPGLFPFGSEFFQHHASLSLFATLAGSPSRLLGLSVDWAIFLWHLVSVFLLLFAAWQLAGACFRTRRAQWAGVALLAGLLTVPVAGTALVIMDPYLTARSLSTPAALFVVAAFLRGKWKLAIAGLVFCVLIHPQMAFYCAALLVCLAMPRIAIPVVGAAVVIPGSFHFVPAQGIYRDVLFSRSYFFVYNWQWFEWLGAVAPLLILWWLARKSPSVTLPPFRRLSRALFLFGLVFTAAAIMLSSWDGFQMFVRLQPMRCFHLVYAVFYVFLGGLCGEYLLKNRAWRWCCLFAPVAVGMWIPQAESYPNSAHVELPGVAYLGGWQSAFVWIRQNTPHDAIFALNPDYLKIASVDQHGFRALAERSVLADNRKDSGAVSLFPDLAAEWKREVTAGSGWQDFHLKDYRRLSADYGVQWAVVENGQDTVGLECPYRNADVEVCHW